MSDRDVEVVGADETPGARVSRELRGRLGGLRDVLASGLVERDIAVRLGLLAALAGEHLLMLGPPGTAKSLIARRLHLAFAESTYFERLLTRFTVPEELLGPLSIKGLEEDRYERLIEGYLPSASIAFLDEIFKANSAILNALLTLLNEREFDNGTHRIKTPLVAVIGASNELPEGEELQALFDRFLLRLHVGPVTKEAFPSLLGLRGEAVPAVPRHLELSAADIAAVQAAADAVQVPEDVVALLCDLRDWCIAEEFRVSDRRWRKVVKLLQVSAASNGRGRVSVWDCWLLQHCLWETPDARSKVYAWYAARVGASAAMEPTQLTRIVVSWEARLKADQDSRSQMRDNQGRPLFKSMDGERVPHARGPKQALRGSQPLFLAPADARIRTTYDWTQISDRTGEGKGYTREDLGAVLVMDSQRGQRVQFEHWNDRDSYLADPSNWLTKEADLTPILEPTRHKELYISACLKELADLLGEVGIYRAKLVDHIGSLDTEIKKHLWVTPDFAQPAAQSLAQTKADVDTLLDRVKKLANGFELLPRESAAGERSAPRSKQSRED